jgi:outer membrane protein
MTSFQQQVQRMGDSLRTLIEAYEKEQISLSPAAKETRQQAIRKKEEEFQTRTNQLEQQAQQRRMELVQPIMDKINKIIEDIRNEDGYTMIFDAGSSAGVVVAADKNLDITDRVLQRLRATASTTPAAKPEGGPVATPSGVTSPKPNQ